MHIYHRKRGGYWRLQYCSEMHVFTNAIFYTIDHGFYIESQITVECVFYIIILDLIHNK